MIHDLKCWPEYFQAVKSGIKPFELRKDDRGYAAGDILHLREFDPDTALYTGDEIDKTVTYVLPLAMFGAGNDERYVIMGLAPRDWTPCAEVLPTEAQEVLFETALQVPATDYFGTYKGFYSDGIFWIDNVMHEKKFGISKQSVIAWQPLPKPWTGGLDGK